jgi:hypothetical protein
MSDAATVAIEVIKTLGSIAGIVLPLWLARKMNGVHKQMNSRMDEALITKQELGNMQGRQEQRTEDKSAETKKA